ncbi:MAG TPA: LytTR family DNA-binding domain-containing protein [Chitinophagaceae bacterium]|jgi:two-component system LytT family response regulator|nr:LytTR family DNA-binding domain-containing protein [Chitinophagaceae bacterium]
MLLRSIIVEDEPLSRAFLQNLLTEFCPGVEVLDKAATPADAIAAIQRHQPDLVFLDIELQSGTGFDVLNEITDPRFQVLFTTAFDHHSIKAIRCSGMDYLLKPIDLEGLQQAIECIRGKIGKADSQLALDHLLKTIRNNNTPTEISLPTATGPEFITISDITRIEAEEKGCRLLLRSGESRSSVKNLKEFEFLLGDHSFFRPHSMHMINIKEIDRIINTADGYVVMNDGTHIPVSPKKRNEMPGLLKRF